MNKKLFLIIKLSLIFSLIFFSQHKVYAEEEEAASILKQLQVLQQDIKTLEKAVYSQDTNTTSSEGNSLTENNDILTKHLLKLSELEEQFKILTNNFEEINFKLDKLSNRITKVQADNQMRFQDLESSGVDTSLSSSKKKEKKLPGSGEAQDLGQALEIGVTDSEVAAAEQIQKHNLSSLSELF